MSIGPISGIPIPTEGLGGIGGTSIGGTSPLSGVGGSSPSGGSEGGDFMASVTDALQTVSDAHARVDELAVEAATGDLTAVHELTMATAEAQLLTQLTVEIRNRAVEAFNDIMRMQV